MSGRIIYICVYGRHKPGKVHKQFQGDGKVFLTGREMVLVCDESKDESVPFRPASFSLTHVLSHPHRIGRAIIPPHKDICSGKEFVVGGYEVQLGDVYDGPAESLPPPPEPGQSDAVSSHLSCPCPFLFQPQRS